MTVQEALSNIHAPKGVSSLIAGIHTLDFDPIKGPPKDVTESLGKAKLELQRVKDAQENCGSDWAYWGYQGDRSYLSAVVDILEAAAIVGPAHLPFVPLPKMEGVVMDVCSHVEDYGRRVLAASKLKAGQAQ